MTDEKFQIALRIDSDLVKEVDARIAQLKAEGKSISRNQWFENMTRWVVEDLPLHKANTDHLHASPPPDGALKR